MTSLLPNVHIGLQDRPRGAWGGTPRGKRLGPGPEEGQELGVRMPAVQGRRVRCRGLWAMEGTAARTPRVHSAPPGRGEAAQTG